MLLDRPLSGASRQLSPCAGRAKKPLRFFACYSKPLSPSQPLRRQLPLRGGARKPLRFYFFLNHRQSYNQQRKEPRLRISKTEAPVSQPSSQASSFTFSQASFFLLRLLLLLQIPQNPLKLLRPCKSLHNTLQALSFVQLRSPVRQPVRGRLSVHIVSKNGRGRYCSGISPGQICRCLLCSYHSKSSFFLGEGVRPASFGGCFSLSFARMEARLVFCCSVSVMASTLAFCILPG